MRLTASCKYCSSPIHYEEEDIGFEVYCDSCGRAQVVGPADDAGNDPVAAQGEAVEGGDLSAATGATPPVLPQAEEKAEDPPAANPPSRPQAALAPGRFSVFSDSGVADAEEQIVGEETCLCGHRITIRVGDYGNSVYCPVCNTEIRVGQTLAEGKYVVARSTVAGDVPAAPVRLPRLRLIRSPLGLLAMLVMLAALAAGIYFGWDRALLSVNDVGWSGVAGPDDGATAPPAERKPQEKSPATAESPKPPPPPLPPPLKVTMEMIEGLLNREDLSEALIDAQVWQETLRDQGVSKEEPRRVRLAAVSKILLEKLSPPLGPPPQLAEFRKLVDALAQALQAGDKPEHLARARTALEAAEAFFETHKDSLATYSRRLLMLKSWLRELESFLEGVANVRKWLDKASQAAAADHVTLALEAEAKARFCALDARPTKAEAEELDRRYRQVHDEIIFAQGKRSAADAKRCDEAGDHLARNRLVRRAFNELSGLPEPQVKPVLDPIRSWWEEMDKAASAQLENTTSTPGLRPGKRLPGTQMATPARKPKEPRSTSAVAKSLALRDCYEAVLAPYYQDVDHKLLDLDALVDACLALEDELGDDETSQRYHARAGAVLFDALEWEAGKRLKAIERSDDERRVTKELSRIRQLLDWAEPWKSSHHWQAIDAAVRQQGNVLAEKRLREAATLAKNDRWEEAEKMAALAAGLGEGKVAARAAFAREKCQAEIRLRADQKAERESWARIQALRGQEEEQLALLKQLDLFARRFPKSPHVAEVRKWEQEARLAVAQKVANMLRRVERLFEEEKWKEAREQVENLQYAPMSAAQETEYARLQTRLEALKGRAQDEYLALGRSTKLLTEEDLLAVLSAVPRILAMDAEHEEAASLGERARKQGALRAKKLLSSAVLFKKHNPAAYRDKLERAAKLDPHGESGKQAHALLEDLEQ